MASLSDAEMTGLEGIADIRSMERDVASDPRNYEKWTLLIEKCRSESNSDALRAARYGMMAEFPLTETMWLEWLEDESPLAVSSKEKAALIELFKRACEDYLSVDLWIQYAVFVCCLDQEGAIDAARGIYEDALQCAGLHVEDGSRLWRSYIQLQMLYHEASGGGSVTQDAIVSVYLRALSQPLDDLDELLEQAEGSLAGVVVNGSDAVAMAQSAFKQGSKELQRREPHEKRIADMRAAKGVTDLGSPEFLQLYGAWVDYADFEISREAWDRAVCVMERAVVDCCLYLPVWLKYLQVLVATRKAAAEPDERVVPLLRRAIRNVTWSGSLWSELLLALEDNVTGQADPVEVATLLGSALRCGLASVVDYRLVFLGTIGFHRRQARHSAVLAGLEEVLRLSDRYLSTMEPLRTEVEVSIALVIEELDQAKGKKVLELVLSRSKAAAAAWLAVISQLRLSRGPAANEAVRKLFSRAAFDVKDDPQLVLLAWVEFERCMGSLSTLRTARERATARLKQLKLGDLVALEHGPSQTDASPPAWPVEVEGRGKKRPRGDEVCSEELPSKKASLTRPAKESFAAAVLKSAEAAEKASDQRLKEECSVFVKNLPFTVTSEALRTLFAKCGEVASVNLVKKLGKSRGMATVRMASLVARDAALLLNDQAFEGRKLKVERFTSVAVSLPGSVATSNTVQVVRFPVTVEDAEFRRFFETCGEIRAVFFYKDKEGKRRDHALVEFASAEGVAAALELNHSTHFGTPIAVGPSPTSATDKEAKLAAKPAAFDKVVTHHDTSVSVEAPALALRKRKTTFAAPRAIKSGQAGTGQSAPRVPLGSGLTNDHFKKLFN